MLGLGNSLKKTGLVTPGIVTDSLVMKHNYSAGAVVPVSDGSTYFDGANSRAHTAADITISGDITFSVWVKSMVGDNSDIKTIFNFGDQQNDEGFVWAYIQNASAAYSVKVFNTYYSSSDYYNWMHLAFKYDVSEAQPLTLFKNGVNITSGISGAGSAPVTSVSSELFSIGSYNNTDANQFTGYICNLSVWTGLLSDSQIRGIMYQNYDEAFGAIGTQPLHWWGLSSTADQGSSNKTLTIVGE